VIDFHYIQQSPLMAIKTNEFKSCQGKEVEFWVRKRFVMLKC